MCGIFGAISPQPVSQNDLRILIDHSQQRGKDSSGFLTFSENVYHVDRANYPISRLAKEIKPYDSQIVIGHSRLVTNGLLDNQPVIRGDICVFHNGIIVNHEEVWANIDQARKLEIDTEVIAAIACDYMESGRALEQLPAEILSACQGIVACALVLTSVGKLCLFSNNGSLYMGEKDQAVFFASEMFPLSKIGCTDISQVRDAVFIDIPESSQPIDTRDRAGRDENLIPGLNLSAAEEGLLEYPAHNLQRCVKCLLPVTMPFIKFDLSGVCNYCHNYKSRNQPRPKEELLELVEKYRRQHGSECIVPFSGGRDSSYGLHLVVKELKMKAVTYTYDWGMVTDLGRRNVSRMCAALNVENIIVADDISKKRKHIAKNLQAWLRSPHLGMISVLTAGDKHFFRYVETIKEQTGIQLNLWGVNPLEVTHFKAGFLGIPPDFEEKSVYSHGAMKQLRYQSLRFKAMLQSPGYFNSSLWDTLTGEYYRSFKKKSDYYHIFDYWRWDESSVDDVLATYDWEKAPDTKTTWRIGDGTAAFYNYIYYLVAGFTEHDTFRSNQIREGDLSREEALQMVAEENAPRYPNIKWYLDAVGLDFKKVISTVNKIPRLYN